jgi:hypothetical protein
MKLPLALLAVLVASALGLSACAGGASGYAFVYGGQTTTQATVDRELKALAGNKRFAKAVEQGGNGTKLTNSDGSITSDISAAWVNALVQYEAFERAVEQGGIKVTAADRTAAQAQAAALFGGASVFAAFPKWFRDLELDREANKVAYVRERGKAPTDADVRAYYEQNKASICPSGKLVSHIMVASKEAADAIEAQLAAGGDFATLAKANSTDTTSRAQGGSLGCFAAGQYPTEFENAANALAPGQISVPVQSQLGWHVISVTPVTYDVAKSSIESKLAQDESTRINAVVGKQVAKAGLKVNPRYGKVSRTASGVQVVPPAPPAVRDEPTSTSTTAVPGVPTAPTPTPTG